MTAINFYEEVEDEKLKFAVMITKHRGRWVFCKHKDRETFEFPGGHREPGEEILDTAKRELYEETGAVRYRMEPICVYSVTSPGSFGGQETFGKLFFVEAEEFESELHSEIESIVIVDTLPTSWTYPDIQPSLFAEAKRRGFI